MSGNLNIYNDYVLKVRRRECGRSAYPIQVRDRFGSRDERMMKNSGSDIVVRLEVEEDPWLKSPSCGWHSTFDVNLDAHTCRLKRDLGLETVHFTNIHLHLKSWHATRVLHLHLRTRCVICAAHDVDALVPVWLLSSSWDGREKAWMEMN